ncbi:MAG: AAA family ATPase [Chitinivibrionales bacterium]|nr:AAA family ATPase [Chitinivibrionales bacterium]MBD3394469.1 AAA family ATPase [Chitinivibrionales bacterium]
MTHLEYWGLKESPFEEMCDTRFFFESEDHREALDRLTYVVKDRNMNMGLLTGEVGSGKTITKSVFHNSLSHDAFEPLDFENSNFAFTDILYDIVKRISYRDPRMSMIEEADLPPRGDKYLLMNAFRERVEKLIYDEKRLLVLIFDEAQQMADEVIDEVKGLTNLSAGSQSYLSVFFVGQPELREKMRNLKQVDQRIFLRFHLNNLDYHNTINYIQHRLRVAGLAGQTMFTSLGLELIFRSTGGVPREINRLCKLAMSYGFAHNLTEISREDIQVVLDDLEEHS